MNNYDRSVVRKIGSGIGNTSLDMGVTTALLWDETFTTPGIMLQNTTAATAGVTVQYSPALQLSGAAWASGAGASVAHHVRQELRPVSAATTTSALHWLFATDAGAYTSVANLGNDGTIHAASLRASGNTAGLADHVTFTNAVEAAAGAATGDFLVVYNGTTKLKLALYADS